MCLIFFSIHQHPTYKLIVVANRDEFYARKTSKADYWSAHPEILGGCDLEATSPDGTCGTWMGMSKNGRIAFITNYRDIKNINPNAPSRGHLVTDFLLSETLPLTYLESVKLKASQYNGFNLVVGDVNELHYFSNYQNEIRPLKGGFYGLSNHLLDTPWPKVTSGKAEIETILAQPKIDPDALFEVMRNEAMAQDNTLPDTGIGLERERALSAKFIKTNGYGTRCSTVILVHNNGHTSFAERTYNLQDFTFETKAYDFHLP